MRSSFLSALLLACSPSLAQVEWQERTPPLRNRDSHAIAYDDSRGRLVVFGGRSFSAPGSASGGILGDTWEWDGTKWIGFTGSSPAARVGHALAYDQARQRVVLFGGYGGSALLADTWEWDGATWTSRSPAAAPSARSGHGLVYDFARQRVVLFGGSGLADTWEWDGTNWLLRTPALSPPARASMGIAYDLIRGRVVVFGGHNGSTRMGDTWEWDGTTWTQANPTVSPSARGDHGMCFDLVRHQTVLFGGGDGTELSDTWTWDGIAWLRATPAVSPVGRGTRCAYDLAHGRVLLFGGIGYGISVFSDLWAWNGTSWSRLAGSASPNMTSHHAVTYDTARGRVLYVGGDDLGGTAALATWSWDGTSWTELAPANAPVVRAEPAFAFDARRSKAVLFGGGWVTRLAGSGYYNDTWEWDGANWAQALPAVSPPQLARPTMVFDTLRARCVLCGSPRPTQTRMQTWEWDGASWQQVGAPAAGPDLVATAMAYDSVRGRTVLFGGMPTGTNTSTSETWEWDGSAWTRRAPSTVPPARSYHVMAFDESRGRVVMHGGQFVTTLTTQYLLDTWEYDGTDWKQRSPALPPGALSMHAMTYDAGRGRLVLFGGVNNDTWEYLAPWDAIGPGHATGSLAISCTAAPMLGRSFSVAFASPLGVATALLAPGRCRLPAVPLGASFLCAPMLVYPDLANMIPLPMPGSGSLALAVPASPALVDLPLCLQGLSLDPATCVRATDGLALRIQKP